MSEFGEKCDTDDRVGENGRMIVSRHGQAIGKEYAWIKTSSRWSKCSQSVLRQSAFIWIVNANRVIVKHTS